MRGAGEVESSVGGSVTKPIDSRATVAAVDCSVVTVVATAFLPVQLQQAAVVVLQYFEISVRYRYNKYSESFFRKSVMDPKSCLHYLLPEPRGDFVDKLSWSLQLQTVAIIHFYTMLLIITNNRMFSQCVCVFYLVFMLL